MKRADKARQRRGGVLRDDSDGRSGDPCRLNNMSTEANFIDTSCGPVVAIDISE